jgi:hypothetical protein
MSADMTLQTASGSTHEGEERAVSINARRSARAVKCETVDGVSVMLTGPHEIIENENTYNEAQNEDHKVHVVLHADWS